MIRKNIEYKLFINIQITNLIVDKFKYFFIIKIKINRKIPSLVSFNFIFHDFLSPFLLSKCSNLFSLLVWHVLSDTIHYE